jgi:hypothetical protein
MTITLDGGEQPCAEFGSAAGVRVGNREGIRRPAFQAVLAGCVLIARREFVSVGAEHVFAAGPAERVGDARGGQLSLLDGRGV